MGANPAYAFTKDFSTVPRKGNVGNNSALSAVSLTGRDISCFSAAESFLTVAVEFKLAAQSFGCQEGVPL